MGIINKEGSLYMATGIDNSGLYSGLNQAEVRIDQFGNYVKKTGDKIGMALTAGFGGAILTNFAKEIINVRGEIQMLESSFEVLLGGKGVSGFMSELKQFAVDSPLSMNGVANAAQTLLGFGIAAEKVMPTIKQIGDISMGNEDRFKSLSLAFAQMSATGKLMGQDLLQMINAGFNPLMTISEKTGKSIGDLKKEMENGSISSQMVADAFASATAEGGKFYGMTQKQAEGIKGLQAQLEGGLQDAYNKIGQSQDGLIAGGYKLAISLVENYETVGKVLMALIATYGTYKAAVIAVNFVLKEQAAVNAMVAASNGVFNKSLAYQWVWTGRVQKIQDLLNKTMLSNPYVLVGTILVGLVATTWALSDSTTAAQKAQENYNKVKDESIQKEQTHKTRIEELISASVNQALADLERVGALEELKKKYPQIFSQYDIETLKLADILHLKKQIAELDAKEKVQENIDNYDSQKQKIAELEATYKRLQGAPGVSAQYMADLRKEIATAKIELSKFGDDVQSDRTNAFISGLKKMTDAQVQGELKARQELEAKLNHSGKTTGAINGGALNGAFSIEQIQQQSKALEEELTRRGQKVYSYTELVTKYQKNLSTEEAKLAKIRSNQSKYSEAEFKTAIASQSEVVKKAKEDLQNFTGVTTKSQRSTESAVQKMRDAYLKVLNTQSELDNESVKQQLDHEQKLLDIEQDSFDKRYRQNQLNAAKEFVAIEEYRQKMAKAQQEAAKDIHESKTGSSKGFNFATFNRSLLPDGLKDSDIDAQVKNMTDAIVAAYKKGNEDLAKEQKAFADEENLTFASQLDQQIYSIRAHYTERRQLAKGNAELLMQINDNENREIIAARLQAHQRQLEADADYNQKYQQLIEDRYVFESDKQKASLEQQIKDQEVLINSIESRLENDSNNIDISNELRDARLQLALFNKELDKTKTDKFIEIADTFSQIADSISQIAGNESSFGQAAEWYSKFVESNTDIAKGVASGDPSSVINGITKQVKLAIDIFNANKQANKEIQAFNDSLAQQAIEYSIKVINAIKDIEGKNSNIFIDDWQTSLVQGTAGYEAAINKQIELTNKLGEATIKVGVKKKKFLGITTGTKDIYDNLLKQYPDLINQDGILNQSLAESLINSGRLNDESKNMVQNALDAAQAADSAMDQVNSTLESLVGSLGGSLRDVLVDAFENGTDAATKFKDTVLDMMQDIATQSMFNAIFGDMFADLEKRMKDSYKEGGDNDITDDLEWFLDNYQKGSEEYMKALESWKKAMKDRGYDVLDGDTQASSKGIQSVTQDSFDEYLGTAYAQLQKMGDIRNINEASRVLLGGINNGVTDIQAIMRENNKVFTDSLEVYKKIEQNTAKAADILNKFDTTGITIRN